MIQVCCLKTVRLSAYNTSVLRSVLRNPKGQIHGKPPGRLDWV